MGKWWKRLNNGVLLTFLLLIPTQLGRHYWPEWSKVWGVRSDYLSPTLYVIDLVWLGLFLLNVKKTRIKGSFWWLIGIILVVVNVVAARNSGVAIYRWIRLGQWWWTYELIKANSQKVKKYLWLVIPVWIGVESVLGMAQLIKAESLNGIWWWLGERKFNLVTMGIAQWSVWGRESLRAYGTFSHPNSMAGFLLVALGWWYRQYNLKFRIYNLKLWRVGWWVVAWLGILGIAVSGSRTVWGLTILGIAYLVIRKMKRKVGIGMAVMLVGLGLMVAGIVGTTYRVTDFLGGWDSEGMAKRMSLNMVGWKMWKENLMMGVGAGNFVVRLPDYQEGNRFYWWQPAHNIFLLAVSEIGILGVMWVGLFLGGEEMGKWWLKRKNWWILGVVVVTGLVDHYWLTLPQNTWLLAVVLGIL